MTLALLIAALLGQGYYSPEEAQAVFAEANEAYARGDYASAIAGYERLLERGYGGQDLLFNVGTAQLAGGNVGQAVLFLERARRAGPESEDLEANLAAARAKQVDKVVGASAEEPFLRRVVDATRPSAVGWTFLIAWSAGFLSLVLARLVSARRVALQAAAIALLTVAVPAGLLSVAHVYVRERLTEAVVLADTLPARELPTDSAKVAFEVHAGLKVRVLESEGSFVRIRLPNGLEGWAAREGITAL
jgi:tetratricopeptide (TPR) repeat protein